MRRFWSTFAALSGGRVLYRDRSGKKRLYLTFDDGPCPENTLRILALLAEYQVKATFFMVGWRMVQWPEVVREVVGQGHELGNHSMSHTRFSWLSVRARRLEMAFADRLLLEAGEQELPPFRLPYAEDSLLLLGFCLLEGRRLALWSRDSLDYRLSAGEVLVHFEETPIVAGDVLLFHDDGPAAVDSLAVLIPKWRSEGFSFGRLSQISP